MLPMNWKGANDVPPSEEVLQAIRELVLAALEQAGADVKFVMAEKARPRSPFARERSDGFWDIG